MYIAKRLHLVLTALVGLSLLASVQANAHEGHRHDMSDVEMAQEAMHDDTEQHHNSEEIAGHHEATDSAALKASAQQALKQAVAENRVQSPGDFLGRLHPLAVHFPIALLIAAFIAELILMLRPSIALQPTVRFLAAGGAIGAFFAAVLGWFAGGWRLADRSETLALHRWNGSGIALLSILAAWLAFRSHGRMGLRVALFILALALVAQGYLGGEMVFGPNHLGLR